MSQEYFKEFTRDHGLILQEVWTNAFLEGFLEELITTETPLPPLIYYINSGALEVWDCHAFFDWFIGVLEKKNQAGPEFLTDALARYEELMPAHREFIKKGTLESADELKKFVALFQEISNYFVLLYYSLESKKLAPEIASKLSRWRQQDSLYADGEQLIKNTLKHLYLHVGDDSLAVRQDEIETPPSREEILRRMEHTVLIPGESEYFVIETLENFLQKNPQYIFHFDEVPTEAREKFVVRGAKAFGGVVRGRARIVRRVAQVGYVVEGDILISPMTTPAFLPAMKKAAAFVTDEGGVLCHAAIIAREMGKPCITGTKIATQIFKDGDLVEVDADNGIVKKI